MSLFLELLYTRVVITCLFSYPGSHMGRLVAVLHPFLCCMCLLLESEMVFIRKREVSVCFDILFCLFYPLLFVFEGPVISANLMLMILPYYDAMQILWDT